MNAQFYTFQGMAYLLGNAAPQPASVSFTGIATTGSASIGAAVGASSLEVGQVITSSLFPAGTYVVDPNGPSGTVVVSQPATGTTPSSSTSTFTAGALYTQNLPLTIHLLTGTIPQASNASFGQMTEATYDGYAPQLVVGPPIVSAPPPRTYAAMQFQRMSFIPADYAVPNVVTGHCWTITVPGQSSPVLVASELYAAVVPLQQPGDILTLDPVLSLGFDQTAGVASPSI